jgi:hypothetical protein
MSDEKYKMKSTYMKKLRVVMVLFSVRVWANSVAPLFPILFSFEC